jgi:2-keto-4-pentenoate hydratase
MPLTRPEIEEMASMLSHARESATSCEPPSTRFRELTLAEGYAISRSHFLHRLVRDEKDVGRKVGLTAVSGRERYGVSEPSFGYLTSSMRLDGSISRKTVIRAQAEGEIVFYLKRDLTGREISPEELAEAVESVSMGIEIIDNRIGHPPYTIQDHVADNAFACGYVLGNERRAVKSIDLENLVIVGTLNGVQQSTGVGRDVLGSPIHSATWLANQLVSLGEPLRAGQIIFSGCFGTPIPFDRGETLRFSAEGFDTLTLTCEP